MKVYDVKELAALLKVSKRTVREYIQMDWLPGRQIGRKYLVTEEALREFLKPDLERDDESSGN